MRELVSVTRPLVNLNTLEFIAKNFGLYLTGETVPVIRGAGRRE